MSVLAGVAAVGAFKTLSASSGGSTGTRGQITRDRPGGDFLKRRVSGLSLAQLTQLQRRVRRARGAARRSVRRLSAVIPAEEATTTGSTNPRAQGGQSSFASSSDVSKVSEETFNRRRRQFQRTFGQASKQLRNVTSARQNLIRRVTGARTARATAVAGLVGRGL